MTTSLYLFLVALWIQSFNTEFATDREELEGWRTLISALFVALSFIAFIFQGHSEII
jgi:hypothetical protein